MKSGRNALMSPICTSELLALSLDGAAEYNG